MQNVITNWQQLHLQAHDEASVEKLSLVLLDELLVVVLVWSQLLHVQLLNLRYLILLLYERILLCMLTFKSYKQLLMKLSVLKEKNDKIDETNS